MKAQELLNKAVELKYGDKIPLFKEIYIIQQRKLHDSGYRLMYVIGHTEYDKELKYLDKVEMLATVDKVNILSVSQLKRILRGKDNEKRND